MADADAARCQRLFDRLERHVSRHYEKKRALGGAFCDDADDELHRGWRKVMRDAGGTLPAPDEEDGRGEQGEEGGGAQGRKDEAERALGQGQREGAQTAVVLVRDAVRLGVTRHAERFGPCAVILDGDRVHVVSGG